MYKVDLHTHSMASPDGGITAEQYEKVLATGVLDMVAVTDHNRIDFALDLKRLLGDKIIVGEEIMTSGGEIIGLFLTEMIEPGLTPHETVTQIKKQGGLVYIPHPFETVRHGIHPQTLEELNDHVDVVEVVNGRAFLQNKAEQAAIWAKMNSKIGAASSDAHGARGLGRTYTSLRSQPSKETILKELQTSTPYTKRPTLRALLYPKYHKIKKSFQR